MNATLNGRIAEYLSYHGLTETLNCFDKEVQMYAKQTGLSAVHNNNNMTRNERDEIIADAIRLLKSGNSSNFFNLWEKYVSYKWRTSDRDTVRLEFFIRLYLATHWLRTKNNDEKNKRKYVTEFREYLDRRGILLADSPDLLPYYALPYVPDPLNHPSFEMIFAEDWQENLFEDVEEFLGRALEQTNQEPEIYQLMRSNSSEQMPRSARETARSRAEQKVEEPQVNTIIYNKYDELFHLCSDLLRALGGAVNGKKLNLEFLRCAKQNLDSLKKETFLNTTQSSKFHSSLRSSSANLLTSFAPLNLTKLKADLKSKPDASSKPYILQALRWRITKSTTGVKRRQVVNSYVESDLLDLTSDRKASLVDQLLTSNTSIRDETIRLIFALSGTHRGLKYITQNIEANKIIQHLVSTLNSQDPSDLVTEYVLGTLHLLCSKFKCVKKIVSTGNIINILCTVLSDHSTLHDKPLVSEYVFEILISLTSTKAAILQCESSTILSTLSDFIEHESVKTRSYVNGILYSILKVSSKLKNKAIELGFEEMINYNIQNSEEEIVTQLTYILDLFNEPVVELQEQDATDDDDEESDEDNQSNDEEIQPEDETEELKLRNKNELSGEELLCSLYI